MNPSEQVREQRMEAVWRERAGRLARRTTAAVAGEDAAPVIVLGIGKERYGIAVAEVSEILPPVRATPVPGAAAVFAGVINVHGEIRPVIDLRRWLGIAGVEEGGAGELARVVLLRRDGREIGLQIDTVEPIRWIAAGDLLTGVNSGGSSPHIKGSTRDLLMLLSTEALFAQLDIGVTT
jgi:purine-binding chemotaxis protein CheW